MTTASEYNAARLLSGELRIEDVNRLVEYWQHGHGLTVDGKAGPLTVASLATIVPAPPPAAELAVVGGWLLGPRVTRIDASTTWYGGLINNGKPGGIVAHFTDTDPGTAINMARRRQHAFGTDPDEKAVTSWHVTIDADGSIVQMVPFNRVAWHAGSDTAKQIPGLGWANQTTVGIELVGRGKSFPAAQVEAAKQVWRAIVRAYAIPRQFAMLEHSKIDPSRRDDPGPVWISQYAGSVLAVAYG
jgi:hypothetical protein